jgi:Transmembrane protein 43
MANIDWLGKLTGSIKGILIGLLLFLGSFVLIYINEGRTDISKIAQKAVSIESSAVSAEHQDELVVTTGDVMAASQIGDVFLKDGDYVYLRRVVESYAWEEDKETDNDTDITTYTYKKVWTSSPDDSSKFNQTAEHVNIMPSIESQSFVADDAKVGVYEVDLDKMTLPGLEKITLSNENVILGGRALEEGEEYFEDINDIPAELSGEYIYKGFGTVEASAIGDVRVSYMALNSGEEMTVFGVLKDSAIKTYVDGDKNKLYRGFLGTAEEAVAQMSDEHDTSIWLLRVLGFVLMWMGLGMILAPISAVLDFVPLIGSLSKSLIGIVTFIIAGILTVVTIMISMIAHNIFAMIGIVVIFAGGVYLYLQNQVKKAPEKKPEMK